MRSKQWIQKLKRFLIPGIFLFSLLLTNCISIGVSSPQDSGISQGQEKSVPTPQTPTLQPSTPRPAIAQSSTISRRIQVPQGDFGTVLTGARALSGTQRIANPGFRIRLTQEGLVVGVSLIPEPRVGGAIEIIQPILSFNQSWDTNSDRNQRGLEERQINSILQLDLIPGRPMILELKDEGSRRIEVIPSSLEVPSFFRTILVSLAQGIQPRVAVLPSEFTLVQTNPAQPRQGDRQTSDQSLVSPAAQEAFLNRTTGVLEDLVLLAGGTLADRREVNRVLLETDLSVSELFSTEGILSFGARFPADYALIFAVQVFDDSTQASGEKTQQLDMVIRLVKIPEGTIEAVYRERVTDRANN